MVSIMGNGAVMNSMPKSKKPYRYILSFGSNLGNKEKNCKEGLAYLLGFCNLIKVSPCVHTKPLQSSDYKTEDHEDYVNMVCDLACDLNPLELYRKIVTIEDRLGHDRASKWKPRELDIDILMWGRNEHEDFQKCESLEFKEGNLKVPHGEWEKRGFLRKLVRTVS